MTRNRGSSGAMAMAHAHESQAKAGAEGKPQGGDLEPVSRLAGGRTPAATSEKMDVTGRRDVHHLATHWMPLPEPPK